MVRRTAKGWAVVLTSIPVVILSFWSSSRLTAGSVDIGFHYQLISYIFNEHLIAHFPFLASDQAPDNLGSMIDYPPLAHAMAALLGHLLGSPFLGMTITALASALLLYGLLCFAMIRERLYNALILFTLLIIILIPIAPFHGWELVGNYFFAQIVGSSFAYLSFYILIAKYRSWKAVALAIGCAWVLSDMYLMCELIFSAAFLILLATGVGTEIVRTRRLDLRALGPLSVAVVMLALINFLSPQLRVMMTISANNGGFNPDLSLEAVCFFALALFCAGGFILSSQRLRATRWGLFCSSLAMSVCALVGIQFLAFSLAHVGSAYAIKKYAFDLSTLLVCCVSYICAMSIKRSVPLGFLTSRPEWAYVASGMLAFVICMRLFLAVPAYDVRQFVGFETDVRKMMRHQPVQATGSTISLTEGLVASFPLQIVLNFAVSVGQLKMPAGEAISLYFEGKDIATATPPIQFALVSQHGSFDEAACKVRSLAPSTVDLVNFRCAAKLDVAMAPGTVIEPRGPLKPAYLLEGWAQPEDGGVWSNGKEAVLRLSLPGGRPESDFLLHLSMYGYVSDTHKEQRVTAKVDGAEAASHTYRMGESPEPLVVRIPSRAFHSDGTVDVTLDLPDAVAPAEVDDSTDTRLLGVGLTSFELTNP